MAAWVRWKCTPRVVEGGWHSFWRSSGKADGWPVIGVMMRVTRLWRNNGAAERSFDLRGSVGGGLFVGGGASGGAYAFSGWAGGEWDAVQPGVYGVAELYCGAGGIVDGAHAADAWAGGVSRWGDLELPGDDCFRVYAAGIPDAGGGKDACASG